MRGWVLFLTMSFLVAGCEMSSGGRDVHPDAGRTVVELRAMEYADPSEGERAPRTFANTDLADCKAFEKWMRSRDGWQRMGEMPPTPPRVTCAMIYGDGRAINFALDDHMLLRGGEQLPLSDDDYQFVKRMCLTQK